MSSDLERLLEKAKAVSMTQDQVEKQRISFAFGNAGEGDEGTREAVEAAAVIMKDTGEKPKSR